MQFVSKKNWSERTIWHNWFAWYPVASYHTINVKRWIWLEVTLRRATTAFGGNIWHNWFAWYPVASYHTINVKRWIWLEVTLRRATTAFGGNGSYWFYEYKPNKKGDYNVN